MISRNLSLLLCLFMFIAVGCDNSITIPDLTPNSDCLGNPGTAIQAEILSGPTTDLTGKVSVFFKLEDKDGLGVANLTEDNFDFYEKGQNDECPRIVSRDEAERKIVQSPQEFQFNITLVLDLSGSVLNNSLDELKQAATQFVDVALSGPAKDRISMEIWWFDGNPTLHSLVSLTNDGNLIKSEIANISPTLSVDKSTDLNNAVINAVNATEVSLGNLPAGIISGAAVIVFTDGRDRAQRKTHSEALNAISGASDRISFFTIGLGSEIEREELREIGKDGAIFANGDQDLVRSFEDIGGLVTNEAYSFYSFEYCSPIRSGDAELTIQATSGLKKGVVEFSYNADNFDGSCSLQ